MNQKQKRKKRSIILKQPKNFEELLEDVYLKTLDSNPENIPLFLKNYFQDKLIQQTQERRAKYEIEQAEKLAQIKLEKLKLEANLISENLIINAENILAKEEHERIKREEAEIAEKARILHLKKINLEKEEREAQQKRRQLEEEVENAKLRLLERKKQAEIERQRIIQEQEEIARIERIEREEKLRQMLEKLSSEAIYEEEKILTEKNEFEGEGFKLERRMTELKIDENLVKIGLELEKEKLDKNRQDETELKLVEERCREKHEQDKLKREEEIFLAENKERLEREAKLEQKQILASKEIKEKEVVRLDKINQLN